MSGFVYLWFDRKHKRYYIGSHWGAEDDGYICSSNWMYHAIKRRPSDFKRRILKRITSSRMDLYIEEERWLSMTKPAELKKRYYNLHRGGTKHWTAYPHAKSVKEKISAGTKAAMADPKVRKRYLKGIKGRDTRSSDPAVRAKRGAAISATLAIKYADLRAQRALEPPRPRFNSEEYVASMAAATSATWSRPGYRERVGKKISAGLKGKPGNMRGKLWWNDGSRNTRAAASPGDAWSRGKINRPR